MLRRRKEDSMRCLLKRIMNTSKMKRKMKGVAGKLMQPYHYYINEKCTKIPSIPYKAFPQTLHGSFSSHASAAEKETP